MQWFFVYILTLAITSALLVFIYTATLVKVLKDKAFTKIILIICMLLVANIAYLVQACAQYIYMHELTP